MAREKPEHLDHVHRINIVHNLERLKKDAVNNYKNTLGVGTKSDKEVLRMLLDLKHDSKAKVLNTLIEAIECINHLEWLNKTK